MKTLGKMLREARESQGMTQEMLANHVKMSRSAISNWERDMVYPEMEKALELCRLFSCTMDQLIREDMTACNEAYSDIRIELVKAFWYIRYAVISMEPEDDAKYHVNRWAAQLGIADPVIIGWDFPVVSQEQINVHHMHGYAAALVLEDGCMADSPEAEIMGQEAQRYIAITIKRPFEAPFSLIPNAYKTLMTYMRANGIEHKEDASVLPCFEKEYCLDGIDYMDVYIAIDD